MIPTKGRTVECPPDRGLPGYRGVIEVVSPTGEHMGRKFYWCLVRDLRPLRGVYAGHSPMKSMWPSTRLGFPDRKD